MAGINASSISLCVCVFSAESVTEEAKEVGVKFWLFLQSGLTRI